MVTNVCNLKTIFNARKEKPTETFGVVAVFNGDKFGIILGLSFFRWK